VFFGKKQDRWHRVLFRLRKLFGNAHWLRLGESQNAGKERYEERKRDNFCVMLG